ncbi:MAG: hypothetical protein SF053_01450 [Bacteroidia bacterium]|nr:hypothetical protein [Bacteroidia bacterium]
MKDRQRVIALYYPHQAFEAGHTDITERLYTLVDPDSIEAIKYIMPSATESGIYYTVVFVEKQEKEKGILGFAGKG